MIRSDDFSGVIAIDINNFPEDFLATSEQINQHEKKFLEEFTYLVIFWKPH